MKIQLTNNEHFILTKDGQNINLDEGVTLITYGDLLLAREQSKLVPGRYYRITDYQTVTIQENTQSAGHQFDVIVRANTVMDLSEYAYACLHEGDEYFSEFGSNLNAWELKYQLSNDDSRFAWAKDLLLHIDGDYDYNWVKCIRVSDGNRTLILADTGSLGAPHKWSCYVGASSNPENCSISEYINAEPEFTVDSPTYYSTDYDKEYPSLGDTFTITDGSNNIEVTVTELSWGTGIIYWMKDDLNNECPYDFKNIMFKTDAAPNSGVIQDKFYYTFSAVSQSGDAKVHDASVDGNASNNVIGKYVDSEDKYNIPINIFRSSQAGLVPTGNKLGENCNHNTFGSGCEYNELGDSCSNNDFGRCNYNILGRGCSDNEFSNQCSRNNLENGCTGNQFSEYCQCNSLGEYCLTNTFSATCAYNILGGDCRSNTFAANCTYNTLGKNCLHNTFAANCTYNTLGKNCVYFELAGNCSSNVASSKCSLIIFKKAYTVCAVVEDGNQLVTLTSTATTSSNNLLRNITIAQGVNNSTATKTISHNTVNDTHQTIYRAVGSQTVEV